MDENEKILKAINTFKEAKALFDEKKKEDAIPFFLNVVDILEKELLDDNSRIYLMNSYKYLGDIYYRSFFDWNKSQHYLIKYLSYDKKVTFNSSYYYMLAYCFRQNGNYKLSYENFRRTYKISKMRNEWSRQILTINEISNYYYYIKKFKSALKLKKIALETLKNYEKHIQESMKKYLYYILYNDMSDMHTSLGNKKKAWQYFEMSIKFKQFGKRRYEDNTTYINAVNYAIEAENIEKAEKYFDVLSERKTDLKKDMLASYYEIASYYYEAKKDYKKALEWHEKYFKTNKTYLVNANEKEMLKLQSKYEVEKKNQEKEIFRIENDELKNINLSKDKFFSIIAHDLRSPFATIYSFISLMKKHHKHLSKEKIMELISELEQIVTNTYSLLENLLEWSRMQSGVIVYQPTEIDVEDITAHVISLITLQASQKNIRIINEIKESNATFADGFMVRTIIRNLLNNAIKFTNPGGKIEVKQKIAGNYLKIFIIDSGIGMSKETQKRLFKLETSFSTSGTNQEKGTGLGLILCNEFVKKNKGDIFVEGEIGKGTTFYFTLPLLDKNGADKDARRN